MRVYLDNNATTPLAKEVKNHLFELMELGPLNPSSVHSQGQLAKKLLANARLGVAGFFEARENQIIFTSSATEALNWAITAYACQSRHIITSKTEHAAIFETIKQFERSHTLTYLPVNLKGTIATKDLENALAKQKNSLIVLSSSNSETGILQNLKEIASLAERYRAFLLIDGVASLGKQPISFFSGISAMVFSSHKIHGPSGCGCLLIRNPQILFPLFFGGHQEFEKRAGTENLSAITGFAKALSLIDPSDFTYMKELRDLFEKRLFDQIDDLSINGEGDRIGNISNLYFPGIDAETLLIQLDQNLICASHGSACSSGSLSPSRVLLEMGYSHERAKSSIRFSLSKMNTEEEILFATDAIIKIVKELRVLEHS